MYGNFIVFNAQFVIFGQTVDSDKLRMEHFTLFHQFFHCNANISRFNSYWFIIVVWYVCMCMCMCIVRMVHDGH